MPTQIPTGSIWPHISVIVLQLYAFAGPRSKAHRRFNVTLLLLAFVAAHIDPLFTDDISIAGPFSLWWCFFLASLEKLCLTKNGDPESSFWPVGKPNAVSTVAALSWSKLKWAFALVINLRGANWNFEVKNLPKRTASGRLKFCIRQLFFIVYCALMLDLLNQVGIQLFYTVPEHLTPVDDQVKVTLAHPVWWQNIIRVWIFGVTPMYANCMQYSVIALVAVATGLSAPLDWAPLYGNVSEAYTLRKFWGVYWHQLLRRPLTSITGALVDAMGIKRGTNASSYIQLWLSFAVSGFFHAESLRFLARPTSLSLLDYTPGVMAFFLAQAAAITFEDFILWILQSNKQPHKVSAIGRCIGYAWVVAVLSITTPWGADCLLALRTGLDPMFASSPSSSWLNTIDLRQAVVK